MPLDHLQYAEFQKVFIFIGQGLVRRLIHLRGETLRKNNESESIEGILKHFPLGFTVSYFRDQGNSPQEPFALFAKRNNFADGFRIARWFSILVHKQKLESRRFVGDVLIEV